MTDARPRARPARVNGECASGQVDEVLDALDELVQALRRSIEDVGTVTERAEVVRRARARGESYRAILGEPHVSLVLHTIAPMLDGLLGAAGRLRRAQVQALYREGLTMDQIARILGVSRQRVSVLRRDAEGEPS